MTIPAISRRGKNTLAPPNRRIVPYINAAEKRGIKVIRLNVGDPDIAPPSALLQSIKRYSKPTIGYAPSTGIAQHVQAWQRYYATCGIKIQPEQIIPTIGATEAIFFALMATTDPGDEIVVFEPFYPNYKSFATMIDITLKAVPLDEKNNFALPPAAEIKKKITAKTKAIVIINPNNPTGSILTVNESQRVLALAQRHKLFIIADETYRDIVYDAKPTSFLKLPGSEKNVIVIDSASKRFSSPGARIGCLVSKNPAVMAAALRFAMARLSAPTLEQYGLIPILNQPKPYIKKLVAEYARRRRALLAALKKVDGISFSQPCGAFYLIIKLPVASAEDFILFLLTKFSYRGETAAFSMLADSYVTKSKGKNEIRLAYVVPPATLRRAVIILDKGLQAYSRR